MKEIDSSKLVVFNSQGDKKRDSTAVPNEIMSCTTCGPNPCTHTINNGCAAPEVGCHAQISTTETVRISGAQEGTCPSNSSSENDRCNSANHIPLNLRSFPHFILLSLQHQLR